MHPPDIFWDARNALRRCAVRKGYDNVVDFNDHRCESEEEAIEFIRSCRKAQKAA